MDDTASLQRRLHTYTVMTSCVKTKPHQDLQCSKGVPIVEIRLFKHSLKTHGFQHYLHIKRQKRVKQIGASGDNRWYFMYKGRDVWQISSVIHLGQQQHFTHVILVWTSNSVFMMWSLQYISWIIGALPLQKPLSKPCWGPTQPQHLHEAGTAQVQPLGLHRSSCAMGVQEAELQPENGPRSETV